MTNTSPHRQANMFNVVHIVTREHTTIPTTHTVVEQDSPFILSVPHGGIYVLAEYEQHFTFGDGIRVDDDMHTPLVYPVDIGSSIVAHLSPHQVNLNRSWEIVEGRDPLYTPSYLPEDPLYVGMWNTAERAHLEIVHRAYHDSLATLIEKARARFGYALVIDCHALNSRALAGTPDAGSTNRADFIIGTLDDTSADMRLIELFHASLAERAEPRGLRVVRNDPYKGGYITKRWARPHEGIHIIQLEIKKKMYMHEGIDSPTSAFELASGFEETRNLLRSAFLAFRDKGQAMMAKL